MPKLAYSDTQIKMNIPVLRQTAWLHYIHATKPENPNSLKRGRLTTLSEINEAENPEPQPDNKRGRPPVERNQRENGGSLLQ